MRAFSQYDPIAVAVWFFATAGIVMFSMNPILLAISLVGAISLFLALGVSQGLRSHLVTMLFFVMITIINPLVSHNGMTVLFVINDAPITAEAFAYGAASAAMIAAVLYWFRSFSFIMTSDKLLYLFGRLSPKLSLILSMGLRYVPLFGRQAKKVSQAQRALGLYKDDNIIDRIRGGMRVFSVMVTWALENGIVTADSMEARGYGIGKRTHFSMFRFRACDGVLLTVTLVLTLCVGVSMAAGGMDFVFYPTIKMARTSELGVLGYVAYAILVFIPTIIETEERIRWKYLRSRI